MIEQNNFKEWSRFHKKLGIGLILLFVALVFGFELYRTYIASTSEIRYTIINFYAPYSDGKGRGMKIHYLAKGKQEHGNCLSNGCGKILTGERRLGYFYLNDPSMYDILYDVVVPDSVIAPAGGWKEIPHWE